VQRVVSEIAATPAVVSEQVVSVFLEFEARTSEGRLFARGGMDFAKHLVEQAFGSDSAHLLPPGVADAPQTRATSVLQRTDPQQLAVFVRGEHPQTIAVLMCTLPVKTSAALLGSLPENLQGEVAMRMACLDRVSPDAVRRVSEAISDRLKNTRAMDRPDGVRALAALLTQVPSERADALLARVAERDEKVAADIRQRLFVFEDLLTIGNDGMKALIARVDRKTLTLALKGASPEMREHFTAKMSQRASEMLVEDMEALGSVRVRDVRAARSEIILVVRMLQKEGALSIGGTEEYVD
jgi:flagellar motor switch protein FliG